MENSKYYPLRVGKFHSCIVSDMPVTHRNKKDMDDEWEHYGGFVIAESIPADIAKELVELFNQKHAPKEENSAHSFTEGMEMDSISNDPEVFKTHEPTIDDQIAFMKNSRHSVLGSDDAIYTAIIHNLESIKRWNETPVYHGEIDVIEDLVAMSYTTNSAADFAVLNGHKAIEMINRFKEEREAGMAPREAKPLTQEAKNWVSQLAKEKRMSDYIPQVERDLLVNDLTEMLPFDRNVARKTANTIVTAIESMDTLKRKYGR